LAVRGYLGEGEAVEGKKGARFLILLDEVQDPHNLGAVLRVAEALGAGVALPERGSAPLSETVSRASAGAVERVRVYRVKNLRRFIDHLKNEGFRVVGLDPEGGSLFETDLTGDLALVLGAEGKGMRRLVREGCDQLARLPMAGKVASLNVSTAASAAGYEALRQRLAAAEKGS
jgi:23S rRNA (guanosine2251-2'-O)-methyltransferase